MHAFRLAEPSDVHAVVDLVQAAFRGEGGWTTEAHLITTPRTDASQIAALIEDPSVRLVLMEEDGALVGCAALYDLPGDDAAHIGLVSVFPGLQDRGIGRALLAELERRIADLGRSEGRMKVVSAREELVAWYLRRGWTATGERVPFPESGRDDLDFLVLAKRLR